MLGNLQSRIRLFFEIPVSLKMYLKTKEHLVASNQITKKMSLW